MDHSSNSGGPTSHPAPCLWPGKAVQDSPRPWDPVPHGKFERSSGLLASNQCSSGHCGHLGSESMDGRSSSLSLLLSVCLILQYTLKKKKKKKKKNRSWKVHALLQTVLICLDIEKLKSHPQVILKPQKIILPMYLGLAFSHSPCVLLPDTLLDLSRGAGGPV